MPQIFQPTTGGTRPIAKSVLAAPAATIVFSDIPQSFNHLQLFFNGRSSATGGDGSSVLKVAINEDVTDANYLSATLYGGSSAPDAGTADIRALGSIANDSAAAGKAGGVVTVFLGYTATVFNKSFISINWSTRASTRYAMNFHGERLNTEAITSITLSLSAGNFMIGTAASLYGYE